MSKWIHKLDRIYLVKAIETDRIRARGKHIKQAIDVYSGSTYIGH